MKTQLLVLATMSTLVTAVTKAEVKMNYQGNSDRYKYKLALTKEDAEAIQSVFGKKKMTAEYFIQSISCASASSCEIDVRAEMYSKDFCSQVNCGDEKFRTNYGADLTELINKMSDEDSRGLVAPVEDWYFDHEHDYVKAYKNIYDTLKESRSKWVNEEVVGSATVVRFRSPNIDIQCSKFESPKEEEQVDSYIPHGAILSSHKFLKTHACRLFAFADVTKNSKPTFVVEPNGFEVKLSGLYNGQLVPVKGAEISLGGDLHGYFRPRAAIYQIPKVATNDQGIAKFTEAYKYWYDDVRSENSSLFAIVAIKNILQTSFASLGLNEIPQCRASLASYVAFYLETPAGLQYEDSSYIFHMIKTAKSVQQGRVTLSVAPGSTNFVLTGRPVKDPKTGKYAPTDLSTAYAAYQQACGQ